MESHYKYRIDGVNLVVLNDKDEVLFVFKADSLTDIEAWTQSVRRRKILNDELRSSDKNTQIKALRSRFDINLKESKELIDNIEFGVRLRIKETTKVDNKDNISLGDIFRAIKKKYKGS
jgi:hypothetical protein